MKNRSKLIVPFITVISLSFLAIISSLEEPQMKSNVLGGRWHTSGSTVSIAQELPVNPLAMNTSINFAVNELCTRKFTWTPMTAGNMVIDAPGSYNSTTTNISVCVMNYTANDMIVADSAATYSKAEQAQALSITEDAFLLELSVNVKLQNKDETVRLEVRNASYSGDPIYSSNMVFSITGWNVIRFADPLFLTMGSYFVYMSSNWVKNQSGWYRSNDGSDTSDTWINNGGIWQLANWDLALKAKFRKALNPSAVGLEIESVPVEDHEHGGGMATVTKRITGSQVQFTITNTTPIFCNYQVDATYFRATNTNAEVEIEGVSSTWVLPLAMSNPGGIYQNYRGSVTGFQEDHVDIQAIYGETGVAFTRPQFGTIVLLSEATRVKFGAPNYVENVTAPQEITVGSQVKFKVKTKAKGNISLRVQGTEETLFSSSALDSQEAEFEWNVTSDLTPGSITLQVLFMGDGEIGGHRGTLTLQRMGSITSQPLSVSALGSFDLDFRYFDAITRKVIEDANVTYALGPFSGTLVAAESGNYTTEMNLDRFALLPGIYEVAVKAFKMGYQDVHKFIPLVVQSRSVAIEVSQSTGVLTAGNRIQFGLTARDGFTGNSLLRPIDVLLKVTPTGSAENVQPVFSQVFPSVTLQASIEWMVPESITEGAYDVSVEVLSEYYTGGGRISAGLNIFPAPPILVLIMINCGVVVALGSYVQRKKTKARRSLEGVLLVHEEGAAIKEKISPHFSREDPMVISGAVTGIVTLIRRITGVKLRKIEVEGGYMSLAKGLNFWVVLFLRENPSWAQGSIKGLVKDLEKQYGEDLAHWQGEDILIPLDELLKKRFGVVIRDEREEPSERESSSEEARKRSDMEHKCPVCNIAIRPGVEKKDLANVKRFPYRHVVLHGQPLHAAIVYLDANFQVRSIEGAHSVEVVKGTQMLEEFLRKWVNPT